jgi:Glycosyl transferases group 1
MHPALHELRFRLSQYTSRLPIYALARRSINRVRSPLWEERVLRHRNRIRTLAHVRGLQYAPVRAAASIHERTQRKDIRPRVKGRLRIYTAYDSDGWPRENLPSAFASLGETHHFEMDANYRNQYAWFRTQRAALNQRLLDDLTRWHQQQPIDVFFFYGGGFQLRASTLEAINRLGIATLLMSLDDTSGLAKGTIDGIEIGVNGIAPHFDLCYTSTLAACEEYMLLGATPYYLPMAANPEVYRRLSLPRDIPVAFFGQRHGARAALVDELRRKGIVAQGFGPGWESGRISIEQLVTLINRSQIVLGHGHHSPFAQSSNVRITSLKARDCEIPMCGAIFATTFDPELQLWFAIGEELLCYRTVDDLHDTIRYLLANPQRMDAIREAAWQRAHREHTWQRRFEQLFDVMGLNV